MKAFAYHTVGSKYHEVENMDIKDIAKLIRKELKTWKDAYPNLKVSVRIERYSMGQSIYVNLSGTGLPRYNGITRNMSNLVLQEKVHKITDLYNFNDNDSQSDYHHVNFYAHVRVDE
jgi:hypothetical protein